MKTTWSLATTLPPATLRPLDGEKSGWLQFGVAVAQSLPPELGALATGNAGCTRPSDPNDDEM